VANPSL